MLYFTYKLRGMKNLVIITFLCLVFILVLFESSGTTQNDITTKDLELKVRIEQLIKQLGADDWYEREDATRALEEISTPAEPFLKAALEHTDTEIILRARKILEIIAIKKLGKLVFVRNETLWTMDGNGHNQRQLTQNIVTGKTLDLITSMQFLYVPMWSPDGTKILFVSNQDGNDEIYVIDHDGKNQRNISNHPADDGGPCWSPDGKQIVFMSNRDNNWEIYRIDIDGKNLLRVTNHSATDEFPLWSPDGKSIAFISMRQGNYDIYVVNPDGQYLRRLTYERTHDLPSGWSPDGDKMLFISQKKGNWSICTMNRLGQNLTSLTNEKYTDFNPAWSPDGQKIAFMSTRNENYEIYIMDASGQNQTRLTQSDTFEDFAAWSPDGKWLIFSSSLAGGDWNICRLPVEPQYGKQIIEKRLTTNGGWMASWQPASSR